MPIDEWHVLFRNDRTGWARAIRNRPERFDPDGQRTAIREWRNDIPIETGTGDDLSREGNSTTLEDGPPLIGVPFLVKDLFDVVGDRTTCSSRVLLDEAGVSTEPAVKNCWLVQRLIDAGAHLAGRTHMNEFAYGLDGRNSAVGDCHHPLSPKRIAGGSSSGSAWAVSAGVVPVAFGTDTGGSIRLPAALCGIYGVRLSWDAERLSGVFPLAPSMDTVGWFTGTNADMRRVLQIALAIEQPERRDTWRIGFLTPSGIEMHPDGERVFSHGVEALSRTEGVVPEGIEAPPVLGDEAVDAYNVIGSSEAWEIHHRWIEGYGDLYDPVVKGLIERGAHWTEQRRKAAEATRGDIRALADTLFGTYDLLVLPASVIPTPTFEEADGVFRSQILRLNTLGSLAGLPALSVPIHIDAIQSSGIQVLAPSGREGRLLAFLELWGRGS